jgi:NAD(P) transhydrogenase subunit alpha
MAQADAQGPGSSRGGQVTIGVPKETVPGETRVSLIPDTVKVLIGRGINVVVESGAGAGASIHDESYTSAGATVVPDARAVYERANVIVKIQAPKPGEDIDLLRSGQMLISPLAPLSSHDLVRTMADRGITTLAMDAVPRITRAQSMDSLSAMSTVAGYKAVLLAADHLPKFFPLLMTAAGTIAPAKVLVLGAGVAGLQAIATARRLGAQVEAYDVRPVVKEQVESLGAKFIEINVGGEDMQTAGGYARQLTPDEQRQQQEALNEHLARFDVVITTALVPGRPAPKMIPEVAVQKMRTGSVIVDLAAETGGNCALTVPGEVVEREGVTIIGTLNLPALIPVHASQMYSRVIQNLLALLIPKAEIELNMEDDIFRGMVITRDGQVVQEQTRKMMGLDDTPPSTAPEVSPPTAAAPQQGATSGEPAASEGLPEDAGPSAEADEPVIELPAPEEGTVDPRPDQAGDSFGETPSTEGGSGANRDESNV